MRRIARVLLAASLAIGVLAGTCYAQEAAAAKKEKAGKTLKWQGNILRTNAEDHSFSIRGGQNLNQNFERQVYYDDSTVWTKQGKPAEQSEFKDGSFVIVLGKKDEKGRLVAERIDLRLPR